MLILASLALVLAPQGVVHGHGNTLRLPKDRAEAVAQEPVPDEPRFERELLGLRRSLRLARSKEDALLQKMGTDFDRIPERCLAIIRNSDPDLTYAAMRALQRYGNQDHAGDLEFLLLTRPFRSATDAVVETMARLAHDHARERLLSVLTAGRSSVRSAAAIELESRIQPEDAPDLIRLSREETLDIQLKAVRLMGFLPPTSELRDRLLELLSAEPQLAIIACEAIIQQGPAAVGDLQEILRRPATGRSYGYAALALVGVESANGQLTLFTPDMRVNLLAELDIPDEFQRVAVALGLAGMSWQSDDVTGEVYRDTEIVDALIDVVAPVGFVSHLAVLQRFAAPRLVAFTGFDYGGRHAMWRQWWGEVSARSKFVGARRHVAVTEANANFASLRWRESDRDLVLRGPDALEPVEEDQKELLAFILAPDQVLPLLAELEQLGFMGDARRQRDASDPRSLLMRVGGASARTPLDLAPQVLDRMGRSISVVAEAERWQIYRDVAHEPDAAAFWRAERRWLEGHPDPRERAARLKDRILVVVPTCSGVRRGLALRHLAEIPDLSSMLSAADGLILAQTAQAAEVWDEDVFRMLELALLAPGDDVWRKLVEVAEQHRGGEGGDVALARMFALIGPERLIESMQHSSGRVRIAAMDEVARLGDLRAVAPLLAIATEPDRPLFERRTAVYALGQMRAVDARDPLLALLAENDLDADLRRTTWVSLARLGGDSVFEVLRSAFPSPIEEDRRAVVQALGEIRDPRAAFELAAIYVLRGDDTLGQMARQNLRRMGDLLASPALIPHLTHPSEDVRMRIATLAGEFQLPDALPVLGAMLSDEREALRAVALIAGTTGFDLSGVNQRAEEFNAWMLRNASRAQSDWLLSSLEGSAVEHTLKREQFGPSAGMSAVPELTRLVLEAKQPYIRALAGRMLRVVTNEDYGTVDLLMDEARRLALVERYRFLYESAQAASRRE